MTNPRAPDALEGCYWGSVNRWECDENDHLNVRFYAQKMNQALQVLLMRRELVPESAAETVLQRIRVQHIRFLREARIATPLRVDCGIVASGDGILEILQLMVNNLTGEEVAAFVTTVDNDGWETAVHADTRVPDDLGPRGLDPQAPYATPNSRGEAGELGYHVVGCGVIGADECDGSGALLPHHYIGRVSDGMPNLWAFLNDGAETEARENGELGGAALEYRLRIHSPLRRGHVFAHLSGVRALGNKTQNMAHVVIDETAGRCAATAEAVGVAMDLQTRKAVPISDERRRRLEGMLLSR